MKYCNICYEYVKNNTILPKNCCPHNICYECYLKSDKYNCMFCRQNIPYNSIGLINTRFFLRDILKISIPRCPCIVNTGYRDGLKCLNNVYPPFKTCISHLKKKPVNYKIIASNSFKYIIFGIKLHYNPKIYLGLIYFFNRFNNNKKLIGEENFKEFNKIINTDMVEYLNTTDILNLFIIM